MADDTETLITAVNYLGRNEIFEFEKPYSTDYEVDHIQGAKPTNHTIDRQGIIATAIEHENQFTMTENGFCFAKAPVCFDPQDLIAKAYSTQLAYWHSIEQLLYERFPEYKRIECFDMTIRARAEEFPARRTDFATFLGPSLRAHADNSSNMCNDLVTRQFPRHDGYFDGKDFDLINVWRVLYGPNDDWPLALCDWQTVDKKNDIRNSDALRVDRIDEDSQLHHNKDHRWYYIPRQTPEDVLIFRNADSFDRRARCFHTAVENSASTCSPRMSVEVRTVCIR